MAVETVSTASLMCTFGTAPSTLMVLPTAMVNAGKMPAGTIMDYAPLVNVLPFAMCMSAANPTVAAATAAALGVVTPMPCIPATAAPWTPGSATVMIGGMPALSNSCKLMCSYGGSISITATGQFTVNVA